MKFTQENQEEFMKKKIRICQSKGFHITFENGWTVSVQFGIGNYCENYDNSVEEFSELGNIDYASDNAEVWAWDGKGRNYPKEPLDYQTPEQVLEFMNKISKKEEAQKE